MSKEKVVVVGDAGNGELQAVKVHEDGSQELGLVRVMEEGKPIHGDEIMTLSPTSHPQVYDVNEKFSLREGSKGPAKFTSRAYRENYDEIFRTPGDLPN